MQTTFIYGLIDPETSEIRYVGKSNRPKRRIYGHLYRSRTSVFGRWVDELEGRGLRPGIHILEEVSQNLWKERECYWIAYYRSLGLSLLNQVDGGAGLGSHRHETAKWLVENMRQANVGRKHSQEWCAKISKARKGSKSSPEAIAKMKATKTGRKHGPMSQERKDRISAAKKGKKASPKQLAAIRTLADSRRGKSVPPFTEKHKANISRSKTGVKRGGSPFSYWVAILAI